MRLIDDDHRQLLVIAELLEFLHQLSFSVATVEARLDPKLVEDVKIEIARCKAGLRDIERHCTV